MTRLEPARYLDHLHRESARFRAVLTDADPQTRVPSCPEWTVVDLLRHLTEVQHFWARNVNHRPAAPDAEKGWGEPPHQQDLPGMLAYFDDISDVLASSLASADPTESAWTWSDDQTVGFVLRRQTHEALIHRLDAELATGQVTTLDPLLATDGVHEALDVMFGEQPSWGTFTPTDDHVCVHVRDTDTQIWVQLGHFAGTDPDDGTVHDSPHLCVVAAPDGEAALVLEGEAGDLDAWLWHRADASRLEWAGDHAVRQRLTSVVSEGIN